jgi:peptide/nickel transport system substrate-binding protein
VTSPSFATVAAALAIAIAAMIPPVIPTSAAVAEPAHGIAMHGAPALPPEFTHLPYADPDAPKGGRIGFANVGTFDSLNPFVVQGTAPRGLWDETWGRNVWESLLTRNRDEPFTLYGLLAETVDVPEDRSSVAFTIRREARFSDGKPVTADDVVFSAELLRTKGRPNYRNMLNRVEKVEKTGERSVRFDLKPEGDRELPLLIGLMPILPKHAVNPETFDRTSFAIPIGSGPYRIESVEPGTRAILRRNPDYWGKDIPVKRGFDNFDEIRVEYFRDANTYFEAFKKGLFDVVPEQDPTRWASGYDFPAVKDGRVTLDKFETGVPKPMRGFVFNTRKPVFADAKVREALTYFLDFEWMNRVLYYGLYRRTGSFFQGSELSALGQAASPEEKELLAPFPDAVSPEVMDGSYRPPEGDGSGRNRENMRTALRLLTEAGYQRGADGKLVKAKTGEPLAFEILVQQREDERLALAYQRSLALAGIAVSVRLADSAQYWERLKGFEFDMIPFTYPSSLSPGTEQNFRWNSHNADVEGSFNFAGVKNPAVDAMITAVLSAKARPDFVAAVRALDRTLISGFYLVPLFHPPADWVARWSHIQHPQKASLYGPEPTTWWSKASR